jgi:Putative neutral zinc metallopeptidase
MSITYEANQDALDARTYGNLLQSDLYNNPSLAQDSDVTMDDGIKVQGVLAERGHLATRTSSRLPRARVVLIGLLCLALVLVAYDREAFAQGSGVEALVKQDVSNVNAFWSQWFQQRGASYTPADLAFVSNKPGDSGCGTVYTMEGPLYCLMDHTLYYPIHWLDDGKTLASYGNSAVEWAIAHEIGHNVQYQMDELGLQRMDTMPLKQVELQADCFAGVAAKQTGMEPSGMKAVAAAAADSGGPDHGTSEQRMASFELGYDSGEPAQCLALATGDTTGDSTNGDIAAPQLAMAALVTP